jgi:hypothetical protein
MKQKSETGRVKNWIKPRGSGRAYLPGVPPLGRLGIGAARASERGEERL